MFSDRYRYFKGTDGRRYCFSVEPVFACPVNMDDDDERVMKLAGELDVKPAWLARKLRHHTGRHRDETTGRLTNDCGNCGARMTRLGFRRWIEAPGSDDDMGVKINRRLQGGGDVFVMVEGPWYSDTRKDARTWASGRSKAGA